MPIVLWQWQAQPANIGENMTRSELAQQVADIIAERYEDIDTFHHYYRSFADVVEGILCGEWGPYFADIDWRSIRPEWYEVFACMPELWGTM
jgi:hypothetical protein